MRTNMGNTDRFIRILIAVVIFILYWQQIITGTIAYVLMGLAAIFLITSFIKFCPLYSLFGFKTCSR